MNQRSCICHSLPNAQMGTSLDELTDLKATLVFQSKDPALWCTNYQCEVCGTKWRERYDVKGYRVTPIVEKSEIVPEILQEGHHE